MARRPALFLLFALSGAASLVYETLWLRTLVLTFGSTVFALGTILAAFMGGLAAGSLIIGRATPRSTNPLRLYGLLEIGIGISALVVPFLLSGGRALTLALFPGWRDGDALFAIVRFGVAFAILLIPTFLMGGTLPAMARHFVRHRDQLGPAGGILYFVNTTGAVLGTVVAGFFLLPSLGMTATNRVAVVTNLVVGVAALALARGARAPEEDEVPASASPAAGADVAASAGPAAPAAAAPRGRAIAPPAILVVYAVGGFGALALEVLWTRSLLLTLGTTVYAFSTMLSTYLLGLALGGLWGARIAKRSPAPERALAFLYGGAGLAVLIGTRFLGTLPLRYLRLQFALGLTWNTALLAKFLLAFAVMLPPTILLGAAFPVALRLFGGAARDAGAAVGRLYGANTAGSILGSLLAATLVIPLLGLEKGLVAVALVFFLISLAVLALSRSRALPVAAGVTIAALLVNLFLPAWDQYLMRSGVYVYAARYKKIDEFLKARRDYEILFYQEGPEASVAVVDGQKHRYLQINGKTDASTGKDMITQIISAHLPMFFHENPKKVLVIGLGCGATVGAVERHPVESVRCLEIAPEVVSAAQLFAQANGDALADPRLAMTIGDGRNFLLRTREVYDVIISEPSNPWIAGVGNLFTREFLLLARAHLAPGGVMCQWTNLYDLSEHDLAIMLATFSEAFPHGAIFLSHLGDVLLVGTDAAPALDFDALLARVGDERIRADLARVGIHSVYDLLANFVMTFDAIGALAPAGSPIHTDDLAQLEFSAPKNLYKDFTHDHLSRLVPLQQPIVPLVRGIPEDEVGVAVRRAFTEAALARNLFLQGTLAAGSGDIALAIESLRRAHGLAPMEENIAESLAEFLALEGDAVAGAGDLDGAAARFTEAAAAAPRDGRYPYYLGRVLAAKEPDRAIELFAASLSLDPKLFEARRTFALTLAARGRDREADQQFRILAEDRPDDPGVFLDRGNAAATEGDYSAAMQNYLRSLDIDPKFRNARVNLAFTYAQTGNLEKAIAEYKALNRETPDDVPILFNLAMLTTRAGRRKDGERLWEELVRREPGNEEFRRNLAFLRSGRDPNAPAPARRESLPQAGEPAPQSAPQPATDGAP